IGIGEADVEDLRAAPYLPAPDFGRLVEITGEDQLLELAAPDHVRPLADDDRTAIVVDRQDLDAGDDRPARGRRGAPRVAAGGVYEHADVLRRRPAAAADDVDPALGAEALDLPDERLRRLVVASFLV